MQSKKIECEIYDRVVGYYRPRRQTNAGKYQEIQERKKFTVPEGLSCMTKSDAGKEFAKC